MIVVVVVVVSYYCYYCLVDSGRQNQHVSEGVDPLSSDCTRTQAIVLLAALYFGVYYFGGVYLPQKMDLLPRLERERNSVQNHVLSYQVKISEGCFVWAAPTMLLRGGPYLKSETYLF
jgi:hypothetical protein